MISIHPDTAWIKPKPPAPVKAIDGVLVKRFAAHTDRGNTHTFARKGGMSGAPTSNNGLRVVPRAFMR